MSLTVEDLKPKTFKVVVRGVELECKPLRLSHALEVAKIGNVLQNASEASREQIKQAEADMDSLIGDLIPELEGKELDAGVTLELVAQMMETIEPEDSKFLKSKGVNFDTDPKVPRSG